MPFTSQKGCSTLARIDHFAFSAIAPALPGSNFRRCPALIATYHPTLTSRFSSRLSTPMYPAYPHTARSSPCNNLCAYVTSWTVADVVAMLCTSPLAASNPMCSFMPKW